MIIKKLLTLTLIVMCSFTQPSGLLQKFYSPSLWAHYSAVRENLKQNGFNEIYFETPDKLKLNGLFLERPNARCTVIICAGWLPGKLEGMADFFEILPPYCNILFFDSRGHAKSEGSLFKYVWRYGTSEYNDALGAIAFAKKSSSLPIIICGVCAGAFNAAHALITLEKRNLTEKLQIKGLIFDSGWGSVTKMSYTNTLGNIEKALVLSLASLYKTKALFKESFCFKALSTWAQYSYTIAHSLCVKPLVAQYEDTTNLFDKIHLIQSPILFVHGCNDNIAYIEDAMALSALAQRKECLWIDYSSHAAHHIKHKNLYQEKLVAFIDMCLQ
jgi:pimeloyl-ACP methyl ester carboxylesterase